MICRRLRPPVRDACARVRGHQEPYQGRARTPREKIRHLEERFGPLWGDIGVVAEAFGVAWAETKDFAMAIAWYRKALAANDGSASIKASEQLGNLRSRLALESVQQARQKNAKVSAAQKTDERAPRSTAALDLLEGSPSCSHRSNAKTCAVQLEATRDPRSDCRAVKQGA